MAQHKEGLQETTRSIIPISYNYYLEFLAPRSRNTKVDYKHHDLLLSFPMAHYLLLLEAQYGTGLIL